MTNLALIDGDLIAYPCAAVAENDSAEHAISLAQALVDRIVYETNAQDVDVYISGADNFRYQLYPLYKANRVQPKPQYLDAVREFLVKEWKADIVNGMETDDRLGIEHNKHGLSSLLCSFDKDMLQLPGYHYNWKKQSRFFVSPYDGLRSFYAQVVAGDGADNIPSYDGKVRSKVPKFIEELQSPLLEMTEEWDMYQYVKSIYNDVGMVKETLDLHCSLLYILREENVFWQPPQEKSNVESSVLLNQD